MTVQKLYGILKFLETLDNKLGFQSSLEQVRTALENLVNSPAQPSYQSQLASALSSVESAASQIPSSIAPSQFAEIRAMGGEECFDPSIYEKIKNVVQTNAMTPAVARDYLKDFVSRRAAFLSVVRTALAGLEGLHVGTSEIQAGSADVAFLIPRDIFGNQLGHSPRNCASSTN